MRKIRRRDKPIDTLVKRQAAYLGEIIHEFHELPGKYIGACANEYPDSQISVPRVDSAYKVEINRKINIINLEVKLPRLVEAVDFRNFLEIH